MSLHPAHPLSEPQQQERSIFLLPREYVKFQWEIPKNQGLKEQN